jgi:fructose-specific phosphotransferase system component IIB
MRRIIFICLLVGLKNFAQDSTRTFKFPVKTTIVEAKKILKEQISEIENVTNFSKMEFMITSGKKAGKIIKDEFLEQRLFSLNDEKSIKEKLGQYYNSKTFIQIMAGNYSFLKIDDGTFDAERMLKEDFDGRLPLISKLTLHFYDNSTKVVTINNENSVRTIDYGKRIDKIETNYTYSFPDKTIVELSLANKSYKNNEKFIDLIGLEAGKATIKLPDTLRKNILAIEFLNKENKILSTSGSSYNSMPTEETMAFYNELGKIFKMAVYNIDSKKITTIKALEENLNKQTLALKPSTNNSNIAICSYQINGTPTLVKIYLSDKSKTIEGIATLYKNENTKEVGPYFIAVDTISNKYGFVDADGKWFKKKLGDRIDYLIDNYYSISKREKLNNEDDIYEYVENIYKIDISKKELINYKWEYLDSVSPTHLKVQLETNGAYGIVDRLTTKEILPIKYGFLEYYDGIFIGRESEFTYGDGKYGAFNGKGEIILPCIYRNLYRKGNYLYAKTLNKNDVTIAFNLDGIPITTDSNDVIEDFGKDEIALIENKNGKKNYINNKGQIIFNTVTFSEIEGFSNGLAIVKSKNNLYGYINSTGKLEIPCIYKNAFKFQEKYALVETNTGQYCLIDKQHKIYKTFKGRYTSVTCPTDSNNAEYYIGGVQYNAEGKAEKRIK